MTSKLCLPAAVAALLLAFGAALAAETSTATTFVRGFRGDPKGGMQTSWYTHLGLTPIFGVRQRKDCAEMEWKSAALPAEIPTETITFVWSGAMGAWSSGGKFTISVNGHVAAECDVVQESTQFPCPDKGCRLLYNVLYTLNQVDSAGHFFLTVPKAWVTAGQPATLQVKATVRGVETWFALVRADDAALAIPDRHWTALAQVGRQQPGTPPPAGEEASYDWYASQYNDPVRWTPIGLPGDPAEAAVSLTGKLERTPNYEGIPGTSYLINSMAFGLYEDGHAVPMGKEGGAARQSLEEGYLPIVITDWSHGDIAIRQAPRPSRCGAPRTRRDWRARWPGRSSRSPTTARSRGRSLFSPPNWATRSIPSGTSAIATAW